MFSLARQQFCSTLKGVNGVVAQLAERLVRNEKVRGSTPLGSTIFIFNMSCCSPRFSRLTIGATLAAQLPIVPR